MCHAKKFFEVLHCILVLTIFRKQNIVNITVYIMSTVVLVFIVIVVSAAPILQ